MKFAEVDFKPVGSGYTCKGIPGFTPKDSDWLGYIPPEDFDSIVKEATETEGYIKDGDYPYNDKWLSLKQASETILPFNLILTKDFFWYQRFLEANELCKKLQLANKEKRIILHKHFLGE